MILNDFILNQEGVRDLLRSPEVQDILMTEARARCPEGCDIDVYTGINRVNVRIITVTEEAKQDNLDNNTLLKVIGL